MNLQHIRDDYPILQQTVHGRPLVYLDNAATLQMAEPVLRQIVTHYHSQNANVHRGVHTLSRRSTDAMESARKTVRRFLRASDAQSIIFTAGTTDGINILARLLPEVILSARDEVIVSAMEHHSNLIPWQEACRRCGATLRILPLTERGDPDMDAFGAMLSERCKIVAVTWVSNVLGTVNPIAEITALSHAAGACVVVDAAQAVRQSDVDVQTLDCDFLAFSGHKLGALTGIGVLYIRADWLSRLPCPAFGGGMLQSADYHSAVYETAPFRLEAGTPHYVGALSLAYALDYLSAVGLAEIEQREEDLLAYTERLLRELAEVEILGAPTKRSGCVSFRIRDTHSYDIGLLLDAQGIAVRTGYLCAQPLLEHIGAGQVVRVSPAFYNTAEELDCFQRALKETVFRLKRRTP